MEINFPSIIKCVENIKSFCFLDSFLFLGTEKGKIFIHDWMNEKLLIMITLVEVDNEVSDYGIQIINVIILEQIEDTIKLIAQMRNGKIFIIEYYKSKNEFEIKLMIETGVESFTKVGLIKINNGFRIIFPSNKENELSALDISEYKVTNEWAYPLPTTGSLVSVITVKDDFIAIALEDSSKMIIIFSDNFDG